MVVTMTKAVGDVGTIADMTRNNGKWRISNGETEAEVKSCDKDMSVLRRNSYKLLITGENAARVIRYSDLHRHSDNSLLDGMTKVDEMIEATEYSGALTDHGNMYGFLDFYTGMKAKGKKPIIGFEAYAEDLDGELHGNHLILLAKNDVGFHNLLLLCSESFDHVKRKPHVTWEMLEKYHEGVIATTACIYGAVPNYINNGDMGKARKTLERYLSLFGEDLYVEIQRHKLPEERVVNPALVELAKEYGIPVIATTDAHYLRKEDAAAHEVLLCLQTKKTLAEPHMTFPGEGYYIHTSEEMEELFADIPEALDNTLDLADKVNVTVPLGKVNMPKFEIPDGFENDDAYFTHLCKQGYSERFAGTKHENEPEYLERYNYEMEMVLKMGFSGYFLIVWDYINWARQNGIYVGPGRGSAAGSLLAYCLGITDLDPIKHNLLFERFLNPERVSMPDVDTDFEHTRRGEVIDYVRRKYGTDNVAHIVTFGTMAARMAIKDVARVLGYPPALGAEIAKLIPEEVHMTIAKAMEQNPDFADRYQNDAATKRIVDIAKAVEGGKRHSSQHACGILISKDPIRNSIPTSMEIDEETGEAGLTAQVTMTQCEDLGTIKMDFLGLKNMTAIHEVVDGVVRDYGLEAILNQIGHPEAKEFRYQDIPLDDRETFEMLARGQTGGVFQLESEGMTKVIMDMFDDLGSLKDDELDQGFERLIAAVALFRPGPLDYIPDYQAGRRDRNAITYLTPELEPILKPTYGQIVFQEQVMQIVQKLAGYSLGRADVVRKAMGKKKHKVMEAEREVFLHGNKEAFESGKDEKYAPGCVANGIPESVAEEIWNRMANFASYAFNRSHAACYAWIANITAYMACHWPEYFFAAMMNAFVEISDKFKGYLVEAVTRGIKILPPDINRSGCMFTVDREAGGIRFGLRGLTGMNKLAEKIIEEREKNGEFTDVEDFYNRMANGGNKPSSAHLTSLANSGAFSAFGANRRSTLALCERIASSYGKTQKYALEGQVSMFDLGMDSKKVDVPELDEYSIQDLLENEFKALGVYLTDHPARLVYDEVAGVFNTKPLRIHELLARDNGTKAICIGQIKQFKRKYTKNGDIMLQFELHDQYQSVKAVVFPKNVTAAEPFLVEGAVIGAKGRFAKDENFGDQLVIDCVYNVDGMRAMKPEVLIVTVTGKDSQEQLKQLSDRFPGKTPIALRAKGSGRIYRTRWTANMNSLVFVDKLANTWDYEVAKI